MTYVREPPTGVTRSCRETGKVLPQRELALLHRPALRARRTPATTHRRCGQDRRVDAPPGSLSGFRWEPHPRTGRVRPSAPPEISGRGAENQPLRDVHLQLHGMLAVEPTVRLEVFLRRHVSVSGAPRRLLQFHRFRSRGRETATDAHGAALGPRFLGARCRPRGAGYGCHFGLGLLPPNKSAGEEAWRIS